MIYYLSLGTNQGDKISNINKAIDFLQGIGDIEEVSSLYETEPVGVETGTENFYNLVLCIQIPSSISPVDLLREIKEFERRMRRDVEHSHNLPRIIDIDILLAGDQVINTEELVIPHKEMTNRAFVLIPLNEIAPGLVHPVKKGDRRIIHLKGCHFKTAVWWLCQNFSAFILPLRTLRTQSALCDPCGEYQLNYYPEIRGKLVISIHSPWEAW